MMILSLALFAFFNVQEDPAELRLKKALVRYQRELKEFEESMLELGPAGVAALKRLEAASRGDSHDAIVRAIARIEELRPGLEEMVKNLGAPTVEKRDEAQAALKKAGRAARPYLEEAVKSPDKEVASRASAILVKAESSPEIPRHVVVVEEPPPARGAREPLREPVKEAPPEPKTEVRGEAPSPNHVWVGGYWFWNGKAFIWIKGGWHLSPRPGFGWQEGRWEKRDEGWVWVAGYWKQKE